MKKTTLTILAVAMATSFALAQTVEEGIKFLYYERVNSAKQTLEKVVASKPKDAYSIYWLGQAYLEDKDIAAAKVLYQKALTDGVNDPWIWVGSGHVELLENGDINSAKQKFEQAITATKGKKGIENADILNAIGRANADGSSTQGDPAYGIEKLKRAQEINKTDPDISINLGICYLKMGTDKGGEAVEAFRDAFTRNPQYAAAYYRTGRIYQSQNNLEFMNEWFGKAIVADPAYAPVYLAYFNYYKDRDVNAAKEYLDKYVANADKDCVVDYFVADYLYRAGKNQESIAKAKEMENGACKDYIRINILYAYNYQRLAESMEPKINIGMSKLEITTAFGNPISVSKTTVASGTEELLMYDGVSINIGFDGKVNYINETKGGNRQADSVKSKDYYNLSKTYIDKFFAANPPANKIESTDYVLDAKILAKFPGSEGIAAEALQKAIDMDTVMAHKIDYMNQMMSMYDKAKIYDKKLETAFKLFSMKPKPTGRDYYDITKAAMDAKNYVLADSLSRLYMASYPDLPQGYTFSVSANKMLDVDTTKGLAVEPVNNYINFLKKDVEKNRKTIYNNYYFLLVYYAQYAKDLQKGIDICDSMIALYPDPVTEENKFPTTTKDQLQKALQKKPGTGTGGNNQAKPDKGGSGGKLN